MALGAGVPLRSPAITSSPPPGQERRWRGLYTGITNGEYTYGSRPYTNALELYQRFAQSLGDPRCATNPAFCLTYGVGILLAADTIEERWYWMSVVKIRIRGIALASAAEELRFVQMWMTAIFTIGTALVLARAGHAKEPVRENQITMAVMAFDNNTGDDKLLCLQAGFREMMVTDLSEIRMLKLVERARLQEVLKELQLGQGKEFEPNTVGKVGRMAGAKMILVGSYAGSLSRLRIDARLIDVETGTVLLAEKSEGKTGEDIFAIEKKLVENIATKLSPAASPSEIARLRLQHTDNLEAFQSYSKALSAREAGNLDEARKALRAALARDSRFDLASKTLEQIELRAADRRIGYDQEKAAAAGEVGRALVGHMAIHTNVIGKKTYDANYFASLLVVSAHAGLAGNPEQEKAFLLRYWAEFTANVPTGRALAMAKEMAKVLEPESKFFQKQVDVCKYGIEAGFGGNNDDYLKPELKEKLSWPQYAMMWPFNTSAREEFFQLKNVRGMKVDGATESAEHNFKDSLPFYPHDYIQRLIDDRKREDEALGVKCSIMEYYARWASVPEDQKSYKKDYSLYWVAKQLMGELKHKDPSQYSATQVRMLLSAMQFAETKVLTDQTIKSEANEMVLSLARQAKLQAGPLPSLDNKLSDIEAFGVKLKGATIVVVAQSVSGMEYGLMSGQSISMEICKLIRGLGTKNKLNVALPRQDSMVKLFEHPADVSPELQKKAIAAVTDAAKGIEEASQRELDRLLASILNTWPLGDDGIGDLVVIAPHDVKVSQATYELARKRPMGAPRIHVVCVEPGQTMQSLAKLSGGSSIDIQERDIMEGGGLQFKRIEK